MLLVLFPSFAVAQAAPQLLVPATVGPKEVPADAAGNWLVFRHLSSKNCQLSTAKVRVETSHDLLEKTISTDSNVVFALRGLPLTEGPLRCGQAEIPDLTPFKPYVSSRVMATPKENLDTPARALMQELTSEYQIDTPGLKASGSMHGSWSADLNRDNYPDLFITLYSGDHFIEALLLSHDDGFGKVGYDTAASFSYTGINPAD